MSQQEVSVTHRLTICKTCASPGADPQGAALAQALSLPPGWEVFLHPCLNLCGKPVAAAVQGVERATYLLAGLTPADADDLAAFAALYDAAPDGWITDARGAGRVRLCLQGRVPALRQP